MMKFEFEQIAGYEVSNEDYDNIIEPMYMATNLSKYEFVKVVDRKRFEARHQKSMEQIELEKTIKAEINELKDCIKWHQDKIEAYKGFYELDGDQSWKDGIKNLKKSIKEMKCRINSLKLCLHKKHPSGGGQPEKGNKNDTEICGD